MSKTIVIDARLLGTSSGRYLEGLLNYLPDVDKTNQYLVLLKPKDLGSWESKSKRFQKVACRYRIFTFSEQLGLLVQLYKLKPDLVHFGFVQQPILYFGKTVTTVHDLTATRFGNPSRSWISFRVMRFVYKIVIRVAAHKSKALITPTEFVRDDLAKFASINSRKISVTYEAADEITDKPEPIEELDGKSFIMYVGRPQPHKNLDRLIEAFVLLKQTHPDLRLALAGKKNAAYRMIARKVRSQNIPGIYFTGFVSEGQMRWMYENARAYVFPSLSEGFGLPGLEAMVHGCPVVSSNATCLPEVYGEAAHYFDPENVEEMAEKISEVLSSESLRKELVKKGHKQVAKYSWEKMAQETLDVYKAVLGTAADSK